MATVRRHANPHSESRKVIMKTKLSLFITSLIAWSLIPAHAANERSKSADEQILIKIKHDWSTALQKGDEATIDRFTAPDWVFTNPEGVLIPKAESIAAIKAGTIRFTSWKIDDIAIQRHGETAVVLALQTQHVTLRGNEITGQFRSTDTFVKDDGRWVCVASQVNRVSQRPQ
jgi:ketosteroid isomerase-like protein